MILLSLLVTVFLISLCLPAFAAGDDSVLGPALKGPTTTVPRYAKFETSFQLSGMSGNPFDPVDNDIWAVFTGPGKEEIRVPAFWDGIWKVRFAPIRTGKYTMHILRNGEFEKPQGLTFASFTCTASKDPGFVRRDPKHAQRFEFDNGETYYPMGCDQAWQGGQGAPTYPEMFNKMHAQGMNWARIWMNHWDAKNLEWSVPTNTSPPIGQYNLAVAKHWDDIVDSAGDNGVYIQMTLQHHGQYTMGADSNWRDNPFNVANGGFLKNPQDFFTDPKAIALTKAKFRYILARWGYSDHIMGWELFNEVQNIREAPIDTVIAWHRTMAAYIRSIDPYHHLITTSYTPPGDPLEKGVDLDYDQAHSYVPDIISLFSTVNTKTLTRPLFWGEWGGSGRPNVGFLHDGLWSGIMTPLGGGPQYWYWDGIDNNNWWPEYGHLTGYLAASGVTKRSDLATVSPDITTQSRGDISFAPPVGWGATTSYSVTVSSTTGQTTGLDGVSSFIQGTGHRDMMSQPIVFHVNYPEAGQFQLTVGQISGGGGHAQILLDGTVAAEQDYSQNGSGDQRQPRTLSINVPAGPHDIAIFNTGPDWYNVQRITLTNYAPAIGVVAKGDKDGIFFWAYNRHRPYDQGATSTPISGSLHFSGLADGTYEVTLWDTSKGMPSGHLSADCHDGAPTVPLAGVSQDIAGWAVKK
jgi:hypothetical protein